MGAPILWLPSIQLPSPMKIHWDEKQAGFQDEPQQQAHRHRHYYRLCQAFAWCFHVGGEISLCLNSQLFGPLQLPKPSQLLFDCLNVRLVARWDSGLGLVLSRYFSGLPALSIHDEFLCKTFLLQAVQFIVNQFYPTLKVLCSRNGKWSWLLS